ncbi:glycosyl hydrolase family 95 catalytic domain-containing protein [Rhizosphaericola mali]|uniref:Glycosyl hydrolase family 95 catalytic domain-containing protein n=1 Tax=Rhizosphaericola mali TaxID=2545455 RepID=A0A5P2G8H8_9BACT|nr:hypothetical protein [Rhizosphaericola mali]QES90050.1 hypothetical protein E0W69_015765 [Rhizosphaericola mali]
MNKRIFLIVIFQFAIYAFGQNQVIDWPRMMSEQDIVNNNLTNLWTDGLFTGNGLLGDMIYMSENGESLRVDVGRTDVYDHRPMNGMGDLFNRARLSIGYFLLKPVGKIIKKDGRMDLWNAEVKGTIVTDKGSIQWRSLTFADRNAILFDYSTTGAECNFQWTWCPDSSQSPRIKYKPEFKTIYQANPSGLLKNKNNVYTYWQPLSAGGGYATCWRQKNKSILISIGYDTIDKKGMHYANTIVANMNTDSILSGITRHRNWWHSYYQKSFFSIPDARMQSFYWIQLYKMASATRNDKPAMDLQGPWTHNTPWPAYWYNLNIQLAYSPLYTANHLDIAASMVELVNKNRNNLALNIPAEYRYNAIGVGRSGGPDMVGTPVKVNKSGDTTSSVAELEFGNLNWILFYYWQQYRYGMDIRLKGPLIDLLRKSTNYFFDVMSKDSQGKIHLPYTYSPEYPDRPTRDCNYSLALFKWSCQTLLSLSPKDSQALQWQDVLENITEYPEDSTGLRIGKDIGFTKSHRHYSHLLMIYPLQMMNWEQKENQHLIEESLRTWHKDNSALQGYSFTGGASIYEMMGQGDSAYQYLNRLLDKFVRHNTMYLESGPVIETPLAAVQSIQEMGLQCRDEKIFVFNAIPNSWRNVSFKDLRAPGAFLISGVKKDGVVQWIRVKSLVGGNVRLVTPLDITFAKLTNGKSFPVKRDKDGAIAWKLREGESVIFYSDIKALRSSITSVPIIIGKQNYWGVN